MKNPKTQQADAPEIARTIQQTIETDTTKFKLCVYYSHKSNGQPYSYLDIQLRKNRKYHDSIDWILTPSGNVTRHDLAFNKLINHIDKWQKNIYSALLFVNDFASGEQLLIGKFHINNEFNQLIHPTFEEYENKSVFYNGLIGRPLGVYKIQKNILPKKPQTNAKNTPYNK